MNANEFCQTCVLTKQLKKLEKYPDSALRAETALEIRRAMAKYGGHKTAPWLQRETDNIIYENFDKSIDYAALKSKYNKLMLSLEDNIENKITSSEDTVEASIRFASAGNYIDFAALDDVSDEILAELLEKAEYEKVDAQQLGLFKSELEKADSLVYLTDNCGEIVLDKLLIKHISEQYPNLTITAMLRGGEAANDATMDDAFEVGLPDICSCLGNGSNLMGTDPEEISNVAWTLLNSADVILAKGQANFETLHGEGFDPYYLFLCKCDYFTNRFGVKKYATIFMKESQIST